MKNLLIVIILGVGGYFAYQYFVGPYLQDTTPAAPTFNMYSLPEECQGHGENLKGAISRHEISATINGYTKTLRGCLRKAGLTDSQIEEAIDGIRESK